MPEKVPSPLPQSGYDSKYDAIPTSPLGNPDFVAGSKHKQTEGRTN